jgi:glycosyltransferase involved in cell wall biosynthesis
LRVLQFINSFQQGGSERQAVQLTRLLHNSERHELFVACLDRSGLLADELKELRLGEIPEYRLTSFYDLNAIRQMRRCVSFLRANEIEVVQTHDFYTNVFGMVAAYLARVPVRIAARRETAGMRTPAQKRVERFVYSLANAVVANADAVRLQLIKEGVPERKIVTIHNGLDPRRVALSDGFDRSQALASFNLPPTGRYVTIVANLRHEVKDHGMFLRAAELVHKTIPDAAFALVGEGELTKSVRALATELGLAERVSFVGPCSGVRLAQILGLSDVCVLSSKAEGFSNSILEYMAAARPVVATDVGGAREAIEDGVTGYLVSSGDHRAMAARIVSLLCDPGTARSMGESGRTRVQASFSCDAQLEGTQRLFEQLRGNTSRSSHQKMPTIPGEDAQRIPR